MRKISTLAERSPGEGEVGGGDSDFLRRRPFSKGDARSSGVGFLRGKSLGSLEPGRRHSAGGETVRPNTLRPIGPSEFALWHFLESKKAEDVAIFHIVLLKKKFWASAPTSVFTTGKRVVQDNGFCTLDTLI